MGFCPFPQAFDGFEELSELKAELAKVTVFKQYETFVLVNFICQLD